MSPETLRERVLAEIEAGSSAMEVAKKRKIKVDVIYRWKHAAKKKAKANGKASKPEATTAAIGLLQRARRHMANAIAKDPKRLSDPAYSLAVMALGILEGKDV